jgi:hypothetical protein
VSLFRACDLLKLITNVAGLSGLIACDALSWVGDIVNVILGGELYTSVTLTWLKHHASHNDRSAICHV